MSRARILIVEDDVRWQNTLRRFLSREGYSLAITTSYEEAMRHLQQGSFHLAIIDIRLVDWDAANEEGMDLLKEMSRIGLDKVTQKIVVTGYGTTQRQRDAFARYGVIDFIPKEGDDETAGFDAHLFLRTVREALSNQVKVNFDLNIEVSGDLDLSKIGAKLLPEIPSHQSRIEVIDLLKRLFYDMTSIAVAPAKLGYSGSWLMDIEPYCSIRGRARPVVVKVDRRKNIQKEVDNFDKCVRGFVGGSRHTDQERVAYTSHLGGIAYSFLGVAGHYTSLTEYYQTHDATAIVSALKNLFGGTCRYWYENRNHKRRRDLTVLYQEQLHFTRDKIRDSLETWFDVNEDQTAVDLGLSAGAVSNPVLSPYLSGQSIVLPVFSAYTHGDLNGHNVLVDSSGNTWLIDFYRTGMGHILRDFVELESSIKFDFLDLDDLEALYQFERALLQPRHFHQQLDFSNTTHNPDLAKAYTVIAELRSLAHEVIRPDTAMQEYFAGLFYQTANLLRYKWLLHREPITRRQYVLLSASMLSDKLQSW